MDTAKSTTPREQLIKELLDPNVPKSEREHAAAVEIEKLREIARIAGRMRLTDWLNAGGGLELFDYAERLAEELERVR